MSIDDWIQDQENRFYHLEPTENEPLVCKECIRDTYIISNLRNKFVLGECLFCRIETDIVEIEYFFDQIIEAIKSDGWVFALDEGSYNSAEGGWRHPTSECNDVVYNLLLESEVSDNLLDFNIQHFSNELMIDKPYGQDYLDEAYESDWSAFKKRVKHYNRFTTFLDNYRYIKSFKNLMTYIGSNEVIYFDTTSTLFRGRIIDSERHNNDPYAYGPPANEYTKNSRMTPKGINCLYCSSNIRTVISELITDKPNTIGVIRFKPRRKMCLVNLTNLFAPHPFDIKNRKYRRAIDFLKNFTKEISKPISIDDKEHLEYIPTQVVFEYLKHELKPKGFYGIAYKASRNDGGINYAIFCNHNEFRDLFNIQPIIVKILAIRSI